MTKPTPLGQKLSSFFLKEKMYFLNRREIDWKRVRQCVLAALGIGIFIVLLLPTPNPQDENFHERSEAGTTVPAGELTTDPTQEAIAQMQVGSTTRNVPDALSHLYAPSGGGSPSGSSGPDRSSSMILSRSGGGSKTTLPPGARLSVRLFEKAIVASQGMPVIGVVTRDFVHENSVAVPQESRLFGEISYDESSDRARIDWRSIQFPDGRERQLSALGVGTDGQIGVPGKVHSEAVKNTIGQTLTRFIGAYAAGSMERGPMGANNGGHDNGLRNAVAETARDRAEAWADDLKKEKNWIEISNGTEFYAVLNQSFAFRDPGAIYGR